MAVNRRAALERQMLVVRADAALRSLELSVTSHANKTRISHVWVGLKALDDEQARLKDQQDTIDRLRSALRRFEKGTTPVCGKCLCPKIAKSDRPCLVCLAKENWYMDRGLQPPLLKP